MQELMNQLGQMTVLELLELTQQLEERWGVQAIDALRIEPIIGPPIIPEIQRFGVELVSYGDAKVKVIKEVRGALGLGLREAKALVERAPVVLWDDLEQEEASARAETLTALGAQVVLKTS